MTPKIFCIGFHKTGTKSLAAALTYLGYRVTGPNGTRDPDIADNVYKMTRELVGAYDAFQDNPWPVLYRELDLDYPNSKFILTIRDSDNWIRSCVRHFGRNKTPMRKWIYGEGCPKGHETIYRERFENHNAEVIQYFQNRSDEFMILDFSKGDGWEKLCAFLEKEVPPTPFPHANRAIDREERAKSAAK